MLAVPTQSEAFKHYFEYHFYRLGMMIVMAITGNPNMKSGVGKSYSAIRIAEVLDEDYREGTKALVKIVHTPQDFIKAMEYIEKKGKRGQVIIIDEAALLVNARKWYSMVNTAVSDVVMTFRTLKCMAIFVTPTLGVIDKNIRLYTNIWAMAEKVMKNGYPRVRIRPYQLRWDMEENTKFKKRFITMWVKDQKKVVQFKTFYMDLPHNKELLDAYEEKTLKYKREVRQQMAGLEKDDKSIDEYVNDLLKVEDMIHDAKGGRRVYGEEVRNYFAISKDKSLIVARRANEKLKKEDVFGAR